MRKKTFSQNIHETRYADMNKCQCNVYRYCLCVWKIIHVSCYGFRLKCSKTETHENCNSRQCQNTIKPPPKYVLRGTYCSCKHKNTRLTGPQWIKHHIHHHQPNKHNTIKTPTTPIPHPPSLTTCTHRYDVGYLVQPRPANWSRHQLANWTSWSCWL